MNPGRLLAGLIPFALFAFLANETTVGVAAVIAAVVALVVALADLKDGLKILPVVGVVILGGLAVVGFAGSPGTQEFLSTYGRGSATLLLAVFILATCTFAPFTAQFAKESTPREYWDSPTFRSLNTKLSAVWGLVILLAAACHFVASLLETDNLAAPPIPFLVNWVLPILAIFQAVKFTKATVTHSTGTPVAHAAS